MSFPKPVRFTAQWTNRMSGEATTYRNRTGIAFQPSTEELMGKITDKETNPQGLSIELVGRKTPRPSTTRRVDLSGDGSLRGGPRKGDAPRKNDSNGHCGSFAPTLSGTRPLPPAVPNDTGRTQPQSIRSSAPTKPIVAPFEVKKIGEGVVELVIPKGPAQEQRKETPQAPRKQTIWPDPDFLGLHIVEDKIE
ncbi:hypothetical protein HY990_02500 [Candidatus Micrarchaeota archaeon]|nr:hypothetical protein [Candidatus Micrarchaeota archaeon]